MFKEKRIIHFEELEPTGKKKKKGNSEFFEYQVEVPKGMEKEKKISEHKEILPLKQFQAIKEREEEEEQKEQKREQKLIEQLGVIKCFRCNSVNIRELKEEKLLECIDCKYKWDPAQP